VSWRDCEKLICNVGTRKQGEKQPCANLTELFCMGVSSVYNRLVIMIRISQWLWWISKFQRYVQWANAHLTSGMDYNHSTTKVSKLGKDMSGQVRQHNNYTVGSWMR
jgi:hypothetical protein